MKLLLPPIAIDKYSWYEHGLSLLKDELLADVH